MRQFTKNMKTTITLVLVACLCSVLTHKLDAKHKTAVGRLRKISFINSPLIRDKTITKVAYSDSFSIIQTSDNNLYAVGLNANGQLGGTFYVCVSNISSW